MVAVHNSAAVHIAAGAAGAGACPCIGSAMAVVALHIAAAAVGQAERSLVVAGQREAVGADHAVNCRHRESCWSLST